MAAILPLLLWFMILSAAIMAGIYFTFSVFGIRAFASLGDAEGARAMQAINRVIVRTAFLPLFFASSAGSAALVILGLIGHGEPAPLIAGGLTYLLGMFGVTVAGNVPLNNRLDAVDADSAEGQAVWRDYRRRWTRLNHVRTLASLAALILFIRALPA